MKKYYFTIIISIILLPIFAYAFINTAVSKQYETEIGECISVSSGQNLCKILDLLAILILILSFTFIFGIYKILKHKK